MLFNVCLGPLEMLVCCVLLNVAPCSVTLLAACRCCLSLLFNACCLCEIACRLLVARCLLFGV